MVKKSDLFPIGIGTWGIGGFAKKDPSVDETKQVNALVHMLNSGMNYVEANLWYSEGYAVEFLKKALAKSDKKREDIFICQAVYFFSVTLSDTESEIDKLLKMFNTDYIDTLQLLYDTNYVNYPFSQIEDKVHKLLAKQKIRYTSITNESLTGLKQYHQAFKNQMFSQEVCYNLEIRDNETQGLIPYAKDNDILNVVYQPLRRNRTANLNWPLLIKLSQKYGVTQNQIILSWLVSKGLLPITKSETIEHIDQHLQALSLKLETADIQQLDKFSPPGYRIPPVDWERTGVGVKVDQLSNIFDEEYNLQSKS